MLVPSAQFQQELYCQCANATDNRYPEASPADRDLLIENLQKEVVGCIVRHGIAIVLGYRMGQGESP